MRIEFQATESGTSETNGHVQSVGVSSGNEYLLFSRGPDDLEDWGVYLEYSDQINSGYECIASCLITPNSLEILLSKPLGKLVNIEGFDVVLSLSNAEHQDFIKGLKVVFRNKEGILSVQA